VPTTIGERLRIARKGAGLSLRAAGVQMGISAQAISKYERGLTRANSTRLRAFSRVYGVPVEFFLRIAPTVELKLVNVSYHPGRW
jgi:transcriptional regulator with XRE-family HTH domain